MKIPTPLAWFNLTYNVRRLLAAIAGVAFAVLLVFMFQGFQNALYDSQVQLLKLLNGDIVLVNKLKYTMFIPEQFARVRLYQAAAFEGVAAAYPFYTNLGYWKNPETRQIRPLRVLAFNLNDPVLPLPGIVDNLAALQQSWTVVMDEKLRADIGPRKAGVITELSEKQVMSVGTFRLGTDFASNDGNIVMSDQNFLRYFSKQTAGEKNRGLGTVDIGLLKVKQGHDARQIVQQLNKVLPKDVLAFTKADFVNKELMYWKKNTNIGFVFSLLTAMSLLVGVILVYQILYTDVAEHWVEYATLKAIGYGDRYVFSIVLQEATLLAVLGFIPGFFMSKLLYNLTLEATGLLMQMTTRRAITVLLATLVMCAISGFLSIRRVQRADPADIFGG